MRAVLTICLGLSATAGQALVIDAPCRFDPESQRFSSYAEDGPGLDVYPAAVGNGFVETTLQPVPGGVNPTLIVLQHCPSGQEMIADIYGSDQVDRTFELYDQMIRGARGYTMRQIAEVLAGQGAQARITTDEFGRCACDVAGGN